MSKLNINIRKHYVKTNNLKIEVLAIELGTVGKIFVIFIIQFSYIDF